MRKFSTLNRFLAVLLAAALSVTAPISLARDGAQDGAQDGVKVEKMSRLRNLVPEGQLEAAAQHQYAGIKQQARQKNALAPENHPEVVRLRKIANQLIPHATRWNERSANWQWEINLIEANDINAFCMPGGKIAFFSGILTQLKLTDDEVAVVMGHEMAHALREHGRQRLAKSGLTQAGARIAGIGLAALLGIDPNLGDMAASGAANLAVLKFSRDDETEADVVGLDIVARAGFDPRAGIALWQKMAAVGNKGAPLQWLSTHPAGANRIAAMQKHLPDVMPVYAKSQGKEVRALPPYRSNVEGIAPVS